MRAGGKVRRGIFAWAWAVVMTACAVIHAEDAGPRELVDKYFKDLSLSFDQLCLSPAATSTKLRSIDYQFSTYLKRHQTVYSLLRTNSKGLVISEVVRGKKKVRKYRKVADQPWFSDVKANRARYFGFTEIEENSRYYLFWAQPIITGTKSKMFSGAICAKIDLWDCFKEIADNEENPFQIRLGSKALFESRWKNIARYVEVELPVPGAKMTARYKMPDSQVVRSESSAVALPAAVDTPATATTKLTVQKILGRHAGFVLAGVVVVLAAMAFLLYRLVDKLRERHLRMRIERDDFL